MLIEVSNTLTVENPTPEMVLWCKRNLTIPNPDYAKKSRMNLWLGNTPKVLSLYETRGTTLVLPFGTLRLLPKDISDKALFLSEFAAPVEVNYNADVPLYDYQEIAVQAMVAAKYGILQSAAGSGKTQMGIALAARLGRRTLWLCHTLDLIKQSKCKRWEKFIKEVTQNDEDKADFLQRALGYSMLGMSNEECMFILHGKTTRNGKSTLLNTIETMLGDYAKVAPVGMICRGDRQKDAEAASPTLAGLKGKRFVTMSESNEYGKLDEEKIKQLTGGEEISARALYQSAITFKPQFTLWLSCNDLPMVTDKSLFASERIKVVEFNRHFSPEEQDTHLKDELCEQSSMSGIFMWLVRGYIHYKERGLAMSGSLKSVVTKYERDNDLVLQFLENRCERVPEESSPTVIKAKDLYNAFKIWAKSEGAYILSARKFNSEMERHPEWFDRKSTSSGYATYCGLKLKEVL